MMLQRRTPWWQKLWNEGIYCPQRDAEKVFSAIKNVHWHCERCWVIIEAVLPVNLCIWTICWRSTCEILWWETHTSELRLYFAVCVFQGFGKIFAPSSKGITSLQRPQNICEHLTPPKLEENLLFHPHDSAVWHHWKVHRWTAIAPLLNDIP